MDDLENALAAVRLAAFDFDGVFTDNRVWVNERGEEMVACCRADGFGVRRLAEVGVECLIVTTEIVPVATARARKLGLQCIQGVEDKLAALQEEAERREIGLDDVVFLGNDVNDAACLEAVGLPVVPADASPEVLPLARLVLERRGGEGCVRELCDAVWTAKRARAHAT